MAVGAQALALSGLQKAALLLIQIGKDRAARVMSEMNDDEVEAVSYTHLTLPTICSV